MTTENGEKPFCIQINVPGLGKVPFRVKGVCGMDFVDDGFMLRVLVEPCSPECGADARVSDDSPLPDEPACATPAEVY